MAPLDRHFTSIECFDYYFGFRIVLNGTDVKRMASIAKECTQRTDGVASSTYNQEETNEEKGIQVKPLSLFT